MALICSRRQRRLANNPVAQGAQQRPVYPHAALGIALAYGKEKLAHTAYNIAVGKLFSVTEVADILNNIVPGAALTVGSGSFEGNMALAGSLRGALDITRARGDLGFEPEFELEKGLGAYIEYLQAHPEIMN